MPTSAATTPKPALILWEEPDEDGIYRVLYYGRLFALTSPIQREYPPYYNDHVSPPHFKLTFSMVPVPERQAPPPKRTRTSRYGLRRPA